MALVTWMSARDALRVGGRNVMPGGATGNLLHVATFAVLGWALARAIDVEGRAAGLHSTAGRAAFAIACAFGVSDEVHQYFTPGRLCSFYDALLDAAGAATALLVPWRAPGRPPRWRPALALLAAAIVVALVSGRWRLPGDTLIEGFLGFWNR